MTGPVDVHVDWWWSREWGIKPPPRLYVHTRRWHVIVALSRDGFAQAWSPWAGWTKRWLPLVISPRAHRLCAHPGPDRVVCSRLGGHRGAHRYCRWPKRTPIT